MTSFICNNSFTYVLHIILDISETVHGKKWEAITMASHIYHSSNNNNVRLSCAHALSAHIVHINLNMIFYTINKKRNKIRNLWLWLNCLLFFISNLLLPSTVYKREREKADILLLYCAEECLIICKEAGTVLWQCRQKGMFVFDSGTVLLHGCVIIISAGQFSHLWHRPCRGSLPLTIFCKCLIFCVAVVRHAPGFTRQRSPADLGAVPLIWAGAQWDAALPAEAGTLLWERRGPCSVEACDSQSSGGACCLSGVWLLHKKHIFPLKNK